MSQHSGILRRVTFTAAVRRRFLVWGSANVLVCLALCLVAARSPETLDRWDQAVQIGPDWWRDSAPWLERPLVWVSYAFGTVATTIVTVGVAGLLLVRHQRRAALYLVLVITGTTVLTNLLKLAVDLPRPVVVDPILEYGSSAMPSGHASNIAAAATVTWVLSTLFVRRLVHQRLFQLIALAASLVVGLDRLMLGVHTLTEVVAGYALGVGLGLLTTYFYDPTARNTPVTGPGAHAASD